MFLTENKKIAKTFNSFFETVAESLIYLVGLQKLMLVMIKFKESYSIFQISLVFFNQGKIST